jgi:hypothetical protein
VEERVIKLQKHKDEMSTEAIDGTSAMKITIDDLCSLFGKARK